MSLPIDAVRPIDPAAVPAERFTAAPEKLAAGSGEQAVWNVFSDTTGQFHCGLWEGAVGTLRVAYTENELCVLLSGHIELADEAGAVRGFAAGDAFVIPAGFRGEWRTLEACRKIYAIFESASPSSSAAATAD